MSEFKKKTPKDLASIMPNVAKILGIENRLKELVVLDFWKDVVKGKLSKESKPHGVRRSKDGLILYIAARSSVVAYELNLMKNFLLDQINKKAFQSGLKIFDLNISTKYWSENSDQYDDSGYGSNENTLNNPLNDFNKDEVELTEDQLSSIESIVNASNLDIELKERMKSVMILHLKIQNYKKAKGYPQCKSCGVYISRYDQDLCAVCKFH